MARIRTVKPEMATDEDLAQCSAWAQLLAVRILNHSDDEGYFKAHPALVKAACFPLITDESLNVQGAISELSNIGYLRLGIGSDGKQYGHVVKFLLHQNVNRGKESKIKGLIQFTDESVTNHGGVIAGTGNREQGTGKEIPTTTARAPASEPPPAKTTIPTGPSLDDLWTTFEYRGRVKGLPADQVADSWDQFIDTHRSSGKFSADWKSEVNIWLRREQPRSKGNGQSNPGGGSRRNSVEEHQQIIAERRARRAAQASAGSGTVIDGEVVPPD